MYKRIFLDANILLDTCDTARGHYQDSLTTLKYLLSQKDVELFTSCDLLTTIYYILSKKSRAYALDQILRINTICTIINFSNKEVILTCKLMQEDSDYHDLEDTLQYILAQKEKCDLIISNDKKFISKDIPIINSSSFIKQNANA